MDQVVNLLSLLLVLHLYSCDEPLLVRRTLSTARMCKFGFPQYLQIVPTTKSDPLGA